MDMKSLREAFGRIPTGVAVVSTMDDLGRPVGMTINSVVPLGGGAASLIWSVGKQSRSRRAFEASSTFALSLLGDHQTSVARRMSASVADRFDGLAWRAGDATGDPLIDTSMAHFECVKTSSFAVGDHVSFIGRVVAHHRIERGPLLYVEGRYCRIGGHPIGCGEGRSLAHAFG